MSDLLNGIPPFFLMVLAVLVVFCIACAVLASKDHARRVIVVARVRNMPEPDDRDVKRVMVRRTRQGHVIMWPRAWSSPEDAVVRGADVAAELWPDEQPMPLEHSTRCWRQRTIR